MLPVDENTSARAAIGGRYRIEGQLGHGGMAQVYRVLDEHTGQRLALKQLIVTGNPSAALRTMFEREYHTLVQLAHPRIVRAFDYGQDGDAPYYTMELLEGTDARSAVEGGSLGRREICLLLRDAASALALIHSRRMVHRDVSPRNLWCTLERRGKLIDFGTLVTAGSRTRIAGTPPFMAPEAVYMQPLEARCDLYGLGALAYLLLTRRHAYPARTIGELRETWQRRPKPPAALVPDLPPALSDLVMALLSHDTRGRPASAAEVFERLTAIAELPAEDEHHVMRAFLASPALVGRDEASLFFRKRLLGKGGARSGVVAVVAPSGLGRSRMLASFVLEAKLAGAATIAVDATAVGSTPFALASALVEQLLDVLPMTAADAVADEIAPVLAHLSPTLRQRLGEPLLAELSPFERVRKLRNALVKLFEQRRNQRLVIAIDDVDRADAASLGVLGRLAVVCDERQLLLVTSCDAAVLAQAPPGLEPLVQHADRLDLGALGAEHTRELLASLFGAVPGLDEAADWLHELSQGSPQACMQYAQYLVDEGIARHVGGRWRLPPNLREHGLPATLAGVLERRIADLSADARVLALGLALARDASRSCWQPENHVGIEDFSRLLGGGEPARALSALDELLRAGVVEQRDCYYLLAQRAMADALLRITSDEDVRRAHARLAEVFEQPSYPRGVLSIRHWQLAGESGRARERYVAHASAEISSGYWDAMRVSVNAECGQSALAHWQAHGGSPREGIVLRRSLLITGAVYDWSMGRFGAAQLEQLHSDCGLVHWDGTDPALPALQRVIECLKLAHEVYERQPEAERGFAPIDAVRELSACAMSLIGAFVNSHDVANARSLPAILERLRPLSPNVAIIADLCELAVDRVVGRELGQRMSEVANRLLLLRDVPYVLRVGGGAITLHNQAVESARRGQKWALELVDSLVPIVEEDAFFVQHGRWLAHAFLGESAAAERFRKRVEAITEDDVWRRRALLFVEAQLHALTGDSISLERTRDAIAELAERFEGWRPWLHFTRAALQRLRGELEAAEAELSAALLLARAGEHRAWVLAAPAHAELLLLRGDVAGALRAADEILQAVGALSLDRSAAVAAERVRALAQSQLGDHTAAAAGIASALALARSLAYDGLPLALLHEAQARIALAAGATAECAQAVISLHRLLEQAEAPALWNAYEALRGEGRAQLMAADPPAGSAGAGLPAMVTEIFTQLQTRFSALSERGERAQHALELLLEDCETDAGHLLLLDASGLFAAATRGSDGASEKLLADARRLLVLDADDVATVVVNVPPGEAGVSESTTRWLSDGEDSFAPLLLVDRADGHAQLSGVALLAVRAATPKAARPELVQAISRCLRDAGDSLAVAVDG